MVLPTGNDPVFLHYQCSVIPLYYESKKTLAITSKKHYARAVLHGAGNEVRTRNTLSLEQDIGFEPMTFSLATRHSTTELILLNTLQFLTNRGLCLYLPHLKTLFGCDS